MNSGGEPERDDTGLPPVDIEIPDDARELDRDVQAYYREQRAVRRHRRSTRLHGVLARDGILVPLLICCLVFALVAGTLLTLFSATSIDQNLPGQGHKTGPSGAAGSAGTSSSAGASSSAAGASHQASPAPTPLATTAPSRVADASVVVNGPPTPLRSLKPAVLLLVPAGCKCDAAIIQFTNYAEGYGADAYLVASQADIVQIRRFANNFAHLMPAEDITNALIGLRTHGLAAVMVAPDGSVSYAQQLQSVPSLRAVLAAADL